MEEINRERERERFREWLSGIDRWISEQEQKGEDKNDGN